MPQEKKLPPIRDKALAYLARRDHTPLELARKLKHAGYSENEINIVLNELESRDWLSNQRFAENFVCQKQARYGSLKLAHELRQRGLVESEIKQALEAAEVTEIERAREVWLKKFSASPSNHAEKAKQMRFLLGRGFSVEVALKILALER